MFDSLHREWCYCHLLQSENDVAMTMATMALTCDKNLDCSSHLMSSGSPLVSDLTTMQKLRPDLIALSSGLSGEALTNSFGFASLQLVVCVDASNVFLSSAISFELP